MCCDGQERLRLHGLVHSLQATLQETEGDLMEEQHHRRDLNAQMDEAEVEERASALRSTVMSATEGVMHRCSRVRLT